MPTISLRAFLSDAQLADAHEGLTRLLRLQADDEVDVTPALLDLLHSLDATLTQARRAAAEPAEPPLENLPLTIATRIAGEAAAPED
jgi:hypothetical protein